MSARKQAINRYELWLAAVRRAGEPRVAYSCPHCNHRLMALKPAAGVSWDSSGTCPYCGGTFFKRISTSYKGEAVVITNICEV